MTKLSPIELDALGSDPTPGDPNAFFSTVATVRGAANTFAEVSAVLHGTGDDTAWRGQAATAFRALLAEDFRPMVDVAVQSLADTARVLDGWVTFMYTAQTTTRRLAADAAQAMTELQRAEAALAALPLPSAPGPTLTISLDFARAQDAAELDHARARNAVTLAEERLTQIRHHVARHRDDYDHEQRTVARAVADAIAAAPNEPGMWDKLTGAAGDLLGGLGGEIADLVMGGLEAVAPIAQLIGDLAAALGAVCGVLAFVPGLQTLGFVAVVLAGVALATHYTAMVGSTGSVITPFTDRKMLTTLAMDGVGLVAGVAAFKAGNAVKAIATNTGQPMRTVAKFGIGQRGFGSTQIPEGLFGLASRGPYAMGQAEFTHRIVQFRGDVIGTAVSGLESANHRDAFTHLSRLANPSATPLPRTGVSGTTTHPGVRE
ncbi:MAG: hypothetical protein ACT4P1_04410 [Sporichthyaceae bacterium]